VVVVCRPRSHAWAACDWMKEETFPSGDNVAAQTPMRGPRIAVGRHFFSLPPNSRSQGKAAQFSGSDELHG
jgi:hypothetical protein